MTVLPGLIDTHPHLLHFSLIEEPLVDRDPMTCPIESIGETVVQATLLGGLLVHGELPS